MWILIWVVLSLFVLGITAWSYVILREQKKAWQAFAKKHGMEYKPGSFMGPPAMSGRVGEYFVSFFTGRQQTADARGSRYMTVIEIDMKCGLPTAAAIGTKDTRAFIDTLRLDHVYSPDAPADAWSPDYPARTRDIARLNAYLTPARLAALHGLFTMKNVLVLFFFDERDCLLRMETVDPLRDEKKMDKIVARILGEVAKLMPTEAERKAAEQEQRERAGLYPQPAPPQAAQAEETKAKPPREPVLLPVQDDKRPK